jgi:hypothetical protein
MKRPRHFATFLILLLITSLSQAAEPVAIGSRRELFVDDALVERLSGKAELRLHQPTPQNVALVTDEPWEGNGTNYVTVFQDGGKYRMYLRIDGFVSLQAPLVGGELLTKPITFAGNQLLLNVSTSAAGSVRIEIQNLAGQPLPGFALADCHEVYGDDLERAVAWKDYPDLGTLAGQPVRLRFEVRDADLYAFRFQQRQP